MKDRLRSRSGAARTPLVLLLLCLFSLLCLPPLCAPAASQDAAPEWQTLESGQFVLYYEEDIRAARRVLEVSQQLFDQIAQQYDLRPSKRFRVWIAHSPDRFQSLADAPIRDWAQGYAFPLEGEMAILAPTGEGRFERLEQVARHEAAHLILGALIGESAMEAPLWFHEGFAMYVSESWTVSRQWTILSNALFRSMIPLTQLEKRFPSGAGRAHLAYTVSFSAVRGLVIDHSFTQLKTLLARLQRGEPFEEAFQTAFGLSVEQYAAEWEESASAGYQWLPVIGGALAVGSFFTPIFLAARWRRRRQTKERMDRLLEEESKPDAFFR